MKKLPVVLALLLAVGLQAQIQPAHLHSSRHFYAPTGRTIPADSIYLNWVGPLIDVNFGITDHLTAGIGTPLFTGVYGTLNYGGALNEQESIYGRVGNLTGFPVVGNGLYSLPYGAITFGPAHSEITLAGGYFFMSNGLQETLFGSDADALNPNSPILSIGGYHQLNNRLGLAYEAWYLTASDWVIIMPGVRFYTNRSRRYWNIGIIRLSAPYVQRVYDPVTGESTNVRKIQNITLPMFSFAAYL